MIIRNATIFSSGKFIGNVDIRIHHGVIQEIGSGLAQGNYESTVDVHGCVVLPGFVDVHIHAFKGRDTMEGEDAVRFMSRELYKEGVSAFLPTTMSGSDAEITAAVSGVQHVMDRKEKDGAAVLGAHMEAPFLQGAKMGAQRGEFFCDPSIEKLREYTSGRLNSVRIITIAPERNGSDEFIAEAVKNGVVVSIGHTTATAEQAHHAADMGATHVTHTFNAQTPLHHRKPGVPGAALTDDRLYAEMICDGIHLHRDVVRLIARAKGSGKAVAITDAMEAAGMPDGKYALGGQDVFVKNGEARLSDGTLAGSVLTMRQALRNLIVTFGIDPQNAIPMTTSTPAESVGEKLAGHMVVGSPVPLTVWNSSWEMTGILDDRSDR